MDCELHEQQATRLQRMLARTQIDPIALIRLGRGDVYVKARSLCLSCQDSGECQRWLDQDGNGSPGFCPVVEVLNTAGTINIAERNVA